MTLEVNGRTIAADNEGYLAGPGDWDLDVAAYLAA